MRMKIRRDGCSALALLGGRAEARGMCFPSDTPTHSKAATIAVVQTLKSGRWSMFTSTEVASFEEEFARFIGARHAVLFNSCTTAIHSALLALGVRTGDFVAVPAYTYIGTCMPVLAIGARPVCVDIGSENQSLCAQDLSDVLSVRSLQAVIQAHLFGLAGDFESVAALCHTHQTGLVHDCAQFLGNRNVTARLCQTGIACFSFGESKLLRIGEGGAAATNSADLAEQLRLARHEGELWLRSGQSRVAGLRASAMDVLEQLASVTVGLNYRPSAVMASLGRTQLRELGSYLESTRKNAEALVRGLDGLSGVRLPAQGDRTWWTFPVLFDGHLDRDGFLAALLAEGVPVGVHFPRLLSEQPAVSSQCVEGERPTPNAAYFARRHVVLPIYPALTADHMRCVVDTFKKVHGASVEEQRAYTGRARALLESTALRELIGGIFLLVEPSDSQYGSDYSREESDRNGEH